VLQVIGGGKPNLRINAPVVNVTFRAGARHAPFTPTRHAQR
jgi:hypothetical protein